MPVNVIRILVIFGEVFYVGMIVSFLVQRGFPTESVFWIAALVEAILGFITYKVFKRYLVDKNYTRWNLLLLLLSVIGFGLPIALSFTTDFPRPVRGTWLIYGLTANSFYLYRMIKKEPMIRQDISTSRRLLIVSKIIHSLFLATVPVIILIITLLPTFGFVSPYKSGDPDLILVEIIFAVISLVSLIIGILLPGIVGRIWKSNKSDFFVYFLHYFRVSFFESVAIYGLILGILGGAWFSWLPLLMFAGVALYFTFPTAKRWQEWKGVQSPPTDLPRGN